MATTPSTIVVCTENKTALPLRAVLVIMKQVFQYGVKDISLKGDKVFVSLSYSPKAETLKKKFGNLPVKYIRTRIESEEEIQILEKALKRYRFNLHEDDVEAIEGSSGTTSKTTKPKLSIEAPKSPSVIISSSDEDEDSEKENIPPPVKKTKREAKEEALLNDGILTQPLF